MSRIFFLIKSKLRSENNNSVHDFLASTGDADHQFRANSLDPAGGEGLWIEIPFATIVQLALKFQREEVRRKNITVSLANITVNEA